ncbi:hypothetical protein HWV62_33419 [Athelia sp. TMB]|nr:hypothetical protein HWV62_33419 [Athelia sp. TMB]
MLKVAIPWECLFGFDTIVITLTLIKSRAAIRRLALALNSRLPPATQIRVLIVRDTDHTEQSLDFGQCNGYHASLADDLEPS